MNEETQIDSAAEAVAVEEARAAGQEAACQQQQEPSVSDNVTSGAGLDAHASPGITDNVSPKLLDVSSLGGNPIFDSTGVLDNAKLGQVDAKPHPGHAIIDEILRTLHVQNAGAWMREKLEALRKTL